MRQAATAEAIAQFDQMITSLLKVPSSEDQERAGDMLCAKGRMQRFMGDIQAAISSFEKRNGYPCIENESLLPRPFPRGNRPYPNPNRQLCRCQKRTSERPPGNRQIPRPLTHSGICPQRPRMCAWGVGDYRKARILYKQTLAETQRVKCEPLKIEATNNLALLDWKSGNPTEALRKFRESLRSWKSLGNRFGWALTLMNIGIIEENMGQYASARQHYNDALTLALKVNLPQVQAATLTNLGNLALVQEKWTEALEYNRKAVAIARKIGDRRSETIALENVALTHIGSKKLAAASSLLEKARKKASTIGDRERLFSLSLVEIEIAIARGDYREAAVQIRQAELTQKKSSYISEFPRLLRLQGLCQLLGGKTNQAKETLKMGIAESRKQKNRPEEKKIIAITEKINTP